MAFIVIGYPKPDPDTLALIKRQTVAAEQTAARLTEVRDELHRIAPAPERARFAYSIRIRPKSTKAPVVNNRPTALRGKPVPTVTPRRPPSRFKEAAMEPDIEVQITTREEAVIDYNPLGADGMPLPLDGPIQPLQEDGSCTFSIEGDDGTNLVVTSPATIPDETEGEASNFLVNGDAAKGAPVVFLTSRVRVTVVHERAVNLNPTVTVRPKTTPA